MSWSHLEYQYPQPHLFHKELLWVDRDCAVYFALKLNDLDNWTFFSGKSDASHVLETGKSLVNYGAVEEDAQTNYLSCLTGKNLAIFPTNFQAKYARLYVQQGSSVKIYEWYPSTYITAHEIISGELTITDELSDNPKISVIKSDVTRLVIGNYTGTTYGLVGYDASSNKVFELSDAQALIAGWTINQNSISTSSGITIDAANKSIYTSDFISGPLGSGWSINTAGAEFQNIAARGKLSSVVFEKNVISSVGGKLLISQGDVLTVDMTALDASTLTVSTKSSFAVNEILRIQDGVDSEYLQVTNIGSVPTYVVTRDLVGSYPTDLKPVWKIGTPVISTSAAGKGFLLLDATSTNSPVFQVFKRISATWSDNQEIIRLGNLNGFLNYDSEIYGLAMGTDSSFVKVDPTNGVRITADIQAGTITGSEIIGATIKTANSGRRTQIDAEGIKIITTDAVGKWGSGVLWGDGTKWGTGKAATIGVEVVPFCIEAASNYGDFRFYDKSADPTGIAKVGDVCVVNGVFKTCTSAGTPGTWTIVGTQTAP